LKATFIITGLASLAAPGLGDQAPFAYQPDRPDRERAFVA